MKTLALIFSIISTISYAQPTASYLFENNVNDGVGINDLNIIGSGVVPTTDRFGNQNCAYFFPSIPFGASNIGDTTAYLFLNNPDQNLDVTYTTGWSISLWYKGGSLAGGDYERIFSRTDFPNGNGDMDCSTIGLYDINTPIASVFKDFPSTNPSNFIWANQTPANLDSAAWHHVVLVVSPVSDISLYVDNVFQDSIQNPSVFDVCNSHLYVGYNFTGKIDDIFYYQSALNATQVDSLFTATSSCTPLNINDEGTVLFDMFPNPTTNKVNFIFDGVTGATSVEFYNVNGQLVSSEAVNESTATIDVSGYSKGIYFVKIYNDGNMSTEKLIIY